ncbi:MAG: TolC family protein [Planctomycetes bacterium]|nr:TolC family protein [Planctomycetota bacterium]
MSAAATIRSARVGAGRRLPVPVLLALCAGCVGAPSAEVGRPDRGARPAEYGAAAAGTAAQADRFAPLAPGRALTLDECLRLARTGRRSLRAAERRVLIARDRIEEARSYGQPQHVAEGKIGERSNDPGARLGGDPVITGEREVWTAQVAMLVPIYNFGGAAGRLDGARAEAEIAAADAERAGQDLELAVRSAYFRVLEARSIRSVVEDSLRVVGRQVEVARDFAAQGLVAQSDVLTAEVQLATRRQEQSQAQGNLALAVATLNRVLGLPVERPTEVVEVTDAPGWTGSCEEAVRRAAEHRPDLQALAQRIDVEAAGYRVARAALFPGLYAFGAYDHSSDDFLLHQNWLTGGFGVQWSLFDGGATWAKIRRQRTQIAEAEDLRAEGLAEAALAIRSAWLSLQEAAERAPVAAKSIELAAENLRVANDQYAQGLISSADLLTEEDRLSRARAAACRATYDQQEAYARLLHAVGGR